MELLKQGCVTVTRKMSHTNTPLHRVEMTKTEFKWFIDYNRTLSSGEKFVGGSLAAISTYKLKDR